jgi:hypothetical protein
MSEKHTIILVVDERADDPVDHALHDLEQALGEGAEVSGPDEDGAVEVTLAAADRDAAVKQVFDAVAAAGADDHFEIAEHPDTPGHWRRADGTSGGAL